MKESYNFLSELQKDIKQFTEEDCADIGKRIHEAREKKGIKQTELARQLAIGKNQLHRIEYGKAHCKIEYLYEIAQILDVSLDYLFFGDDRSAETEEDIVVGEIVGLCRGKDIGSLYKALNVLRVLFE